MIGGGIYLITVRWESLHRCNRLLTLRSQLHVTMKVCPETTVLPFSRRRLRVGTGSAPF
jgi:hypothetical protein